MKWRCELLRSQKFQRARTQLNYFEAPAKIGKFVRDNEEEDITVQKTYKQKYGINYTVQQAEWLGGFPEDPANWLIVPYPKGMRCLVIAFGGKTEVYSKNGPLVTTFKSYLPGGFPDTYNRSKVTILDCVQVEKNKSYQIIDALICGNMELLNWPADFRFLWTKSRLGDWKCNGNFDAEFHIPNYYDMSNNSDVMQCFEKFPFWDDIELDAFMFYHKDSSYTCGKSPLVGWLYPFMVNEVLGFRIHEKYQALRPQNYWNAQSFIETFDEQIKDRRGRCKLYHKHHNKVTSGDSKTTEDFKNVESNFMSSDEEIKEIETECELNIETEYPIFPEGARSNIKNENADAGKKQIQILKIEKKTLKPKLKSKMQLSDKKEKSKLRQRRKWIHLSLEDII